MPNTNLTRRSILTGGTAFILADISTPTAAENAIGRVLVVGGSGRTGAMVVKDLLARGLKVRGLARRIDQAKVDIPQAEWVEGDVRQPQSLPSALKDIDAIVYAVGGTREHDPTNSAAAIFDIGVRDLVTAAKAAGTKHVVLLSSAGVTRIGGPNADPLHEVMTAKKNGEAHVRNSGLSYAIVRTHGVWDKSVGELGILLIQGDLAYKSRLMTARADIARVLAECVTNASAYGKSFEIMNAASPDADKWKEEFVRLKAD